MQLRSKQKPQARRHVGYSGYSDSGGPRGTNGQSGAPVGVPRGTPRFTVPLCNQGVPRGGTQGAPLHAGTPVYPRGAPTGVPPWGAHLLHSTTDTRCSGPCSSSRAADSSSATTCAGRQRAIREYSTPCVPYVSTRAQRTAAPRPPAKVGSGPYVSTRRPAPYLSTRGPVCRIAPRAIARRSGWGVPASAPCKALRCKTTRQCNGAALQNNAAMQRCGVAKQRGNATVRRCKQRGNRCGGFAVRRAARRRSWARRTPRRSGGTRSCTGTHAVLSGTLGYARVLSGTRSCTGPHGLEPRGAGVGRSAMR